MLKTKRKREREDSPPPLEASTKHRSIFGGEDSTPMLVSSSEKQSISTVPSTHSAATGTVMTIPLSARRPFGIVEILENVFLQLDEGKLEDSIPRLLKLREVSTWWKGVIDGSPRLKRMLFIMAAAQPALPDAPVIPVRYIERRRQLRSWLSRVQIDPNCFFQQTCLPNNRLTGAGLIYSEGSITLSSKQWPVELPPYVSINPLAIMGGNIGWGGLSQRVDRLTNNELEINLIRYALDPDWVQNVLHYPDGLIANMLVAQPPLSRITVSTCENRAGPTPKPIQCAGVTLKDLETGLRELYKD